MPNDPKLKILERDNGFRDAHFGADTTSFSDLIFDMEIKDDLLARNYRLYTRANEEKTAYDASVEEIVYSFEHGKLTSIAINAVGGVNSAALFAGVRAKYGLGLKRPVSSLGDYWWSTEHVLLSYKRDVKSNTAAVTLSSKPGKSKAATDKKAASDL